MNDIVINKVQSIQRCVARAREEFGLAGESFRENHSHQDAAILNISRACEQAIDLANHVIKREKLGIPSSSAESFTLLRGKGIISGDLERHMQNMIGFRNVVVHEYRKLDIEIVESVIKDRLDDLVEFGQRILEHG